MVATGSKEEGLVDVSHCFKGGQGRNRTTDTRIFSILGTVSRWFPICLSTSAKGEFSEQHAVRRSQEFPISPYFSVHDYTGITQTQGQTKLLEGLAKSFDHSLEKRGGGGKLAIRTMFVTRSVTPIKF